MTSSPFTKKTEGTRRKFLIIPPPNLQTPLPVRKGGLVPPPDTRPGPTRVSLDTNSHPPQALHSVRATSLFSESSNFTCYCIIPLANPSVSLDARFFFPLRLHFYVVFPWRVSLKGTWLILCPFSEFSLPLPSPSVLSRKLLLRSLTSKFQMQSSFFYPLFLWNRFPSFTPITAP